MSSFEMATCGVPPGHVPDTSRIRPQARPFEQFKDMKNRIGATKRRRTKDGQANILQKNFFVALSSSEMIALTCLLSILHLSIVVPFRWLAGKTHELKEYNSSLLLMGRVLDTLVEKLNEIKSNPKLIFKSSFMMDIFNNHQEELPPFKQYWEDTFKKQ